MGKFTHSKPKRIHQVGAMEISGSSNSNSQQVGVGVGVTTRAKSRTLAVAEAETKRKLKFSSSSSSFPSDIQLRSRRKLDNYSPPPATASTPALSSNNSLSGHNSDRATVVGRCLSDGSSELIDKSSRSDADLEKFENSPCIESPEKTPSLDLHSQSNTNTMESASSEVNSQQRRLAAEAKMPTASEIEDFFSALEKDDKKRFTEKYNFDFEKEVPLEGRYEWSRVKP